MNESPKMSNYYPRLERVLPIIFVIVVGTLVVVPFYLTQRKHSPGNQLTNVIAVHDLVEHVVVMEQFDKVLRSGVIYPRWLSDINNGYGNAWPNFYSPGFYYLSSLIHVLIDDWLGVLFIASVVAMGGSGIAMYALSRALYGRLASCVAALLYMLLPFHLINLYWQGAMPQLTGFAFMPLVFYFAFKLVIHPRPVHYAALGAAYGLYVLTHLPVSYLTSYALAFYAVVWAVLERDWRIVVRIGIGMTLGLILSAIYWLPALLEAKYSYENVSAMFPYHSSYLLLLPPGDVFASMINDTFMLQALLLAVAIMILRPSNRHKTATNSDRVTRSFIIVGVATTFMATSLSIYASKLIPRIEVVSFPWRWIAVASVFTALMAGAATDKLAGPGEITRMRRWASYAGLVTVVVLNLWLAVNSVIIPPVSAPSFRTTEGLLESNYTPKGATLPTALPDTPNVTVRPEGGVFEVIRWDPQYRKIALRLDHPSEVRLKTYNFPGWTARIDGENASLSSDSDGIQVVSIPPGRHTIETEFVNTPPRRFAGILTGLGLAIVVALAVVDSLQRRKFEETAKQEVADVDDGKARRLAPANMFLRHAMLAAGMLVAIGGICASLALTVRIVSPGVPSRTDIAASIATGQEPVASFGVGSEVRLSVEGMASIPVAVDEKALDELASALAARSDVRIEELVRSGKAFDVETNTRARIIDRALAKTKVRIIEGKQVTLEGWVPERWLR